MKFPILVILLIGWNLLSCSSEVNTSLSCSSEVNTSEPIQAPVMNRSSPTRLWLGFVSFETCQVLPTMDLRTMYWMTWTFAIFSSVLLFCTLTGRSPFEPYSRICRDFGMVVVEVEPLWKNR
uniref:Uncharacterized protein n=1 Tax=Acrobeloides nanus TaxID=290746 RepID=A0A914C6G7_9BILA